MASCSSSYCSIRKPLSNVAVGSLLDATISVLLTKAYIFAKLKISLSNNSTTNIEYVYTVKSST